MQRFPSRGRYKTLSSLSAPSAITVGALAHIARKQKSFAQIRLRTRWEMYRKIALLGWILLSASSSALAQDKWPTRAIRWIVPYAAGGFADLRARKLAIDLAKNLGQPVYIENRAGAGGVVGTDALAKAAPDGYTIGMGNLAALSVNV